MAIRKTAKKSSSRATLNVNIDKPNKRTSKKINKNIKKLNPLTIFIAVVLLAVGAIGGFFGVKVLTKNDCFEIVGSEYITLVTGENYVDQGVKVVAFNKDDSDKVIVETNLQQREDGSFYSDEIGTYYITYNVANIKYGSIFKIQKVRIVDVVEEPELEEVENAQEGTNE